MNCPELWIVAGPNGAGKTTCVQREPISSILPQIPFQNPDDRTRAKLIALGYQGFHDAPVDVQTRLFFESADEVFIDLQKAIADHRPIGVETVLSSDKYRTLVEAVQNKNGFVRLIYVALSSSLIAMERVAARVQRGGHGIPADKIALRWQRSLDNLPWFAMHASAFWVIDNSDSNPANPPRLIACGERGLIEQCDESTFPEMKIALSGLQRKRSANG